MSAKIDDKIVFRFFLDLLKKKDAENQWHIPIFGFNAESLNNNGLRRGEENLRFGKNLYRLIKEFNQENQKDDLLKILEKLDKTQQKDSNLPYSYTIDLIDVFKILDIISNSSRNQSYSINRKLKINLLELIWPRFIRRSIQCLRDIDKRDKGVYKSDFGVVELKNYFEEYSKFEQLLFGAHEYQREHILHVFRDYLLGVYLVCKDKFLTNKKDSIKNFDKIKLDEIYEEAEDKKDQADNYQEKFAIWTIIALTHDLGYPLEKLSKINQRVFDMMKYFGTSNFYTLRYNLPLQGQFLNEHILRFISSKLVKTKSDECSEYMVSIQSKYYSKFSNSFEGLKHGIISSLLLMKNLVYFKESDFPRKEKRINQQEACQFLIRREILRAIASHDCDDIYHIRNDTMSFLLIITDELQEWDRPYAKDKNEADKESTVYIKKYTDNKICIELDYATIQQDFYEKLKFKVRKFIRIFRSAVASEKRKFSFEIVFKRNSKIAEHESEKEPKLINQEKIPELRRCDYWQLLFPKPRADKDRYSPPRLIVYINDRFQRVDFRDLFDFD